MRTGDPVFSRNGEPAVVLARQANNDVLRADARPEQLREQFRHGYIKGLESSERKQFNAIMDSILEIDDVHEQLSALKGKIETFERQESPSPQGLRFARYLKSELFHLMQVNNIQPREYNIPYFEAIKS